MSDRALHAGGWILVAMLLAAGPGPARGALPVVESERPVELGTTITIRSEVLGESRPLNILLPPGYDEAGSADLRFPVIYLLDGGVGEDYHHVSGLVQFLTVYELMPRSILVGIANTDRTRDMTFPSSDPEDRENAPTHGGSSRFRQFLAEELLPFVDGRYRTDETRLLIGQSLAGLFATELFVEAPQLFDDYVIVSPSLWWDGFSLVPRLGAAVRENPDLAARVCIAVGTEGAGMEGPAHAFAAALADSPAEALRWTFLPLPEESHATILHRALYRSFEWLYGEDWPGL